jgi:regulation of enolase protein 1 (concanavalin A-like superfamily)
VNSLSIAAAVEHIFDLITILDDAYWEANSCEEKDHVHNLSSILTAEYIELSKVSVQDHHFEYEVISISKEVLKQALTQLQLRVPTQIRRQTTFVKLNALLNRFIVALS